MAERDNNVSTEENLADVLPQRHQIVKVEVLQDLIEGKKVQELRNLVKEEEPIDVATALEEMEDRDILFFFKTVQNEFTAEIFSYLSHDAQEKLAETLSSSEVLNLVDELSTDDLVDFIEELPSNLVKKVLQATDKADKEKRQNVNAFLKFNKDSAGSIMTTEFVEIKETSTAGQALERIRAVGPNAETIHTTFVIDSSRQLIGTLRLDDLIFANPEDPVKEIMDDDFIFVDTAADQEEVALLFKKYDLAVMPVVNSSGRLVGIITFDDVMDVIEEETTEDMQKMAGTTPIDTPYLKTSVFKIAKSRVLWLLVLMISATLTGLIINQFEAVLTVVPVLSVFIPMLMDTSGNAGNQTTTTITRALGVGEIRLRDYSRVLLKEFLVSLLTGFVVAAFNFIWILIELQTGFIANTSGNASWLIALQVSLTLYIIIILAKCLGSSLPMFAKLIHVDPALMAGPLITTLLDTASLIIYFLFAKLLLKILL